MSARRGRLALWGALTLALALSVVVGRARARARGTDLPRDPTSTRDRGTRAIVDAAQRLGWRPTFAPMSRPAQLDSGATYFVPGSEDGESPGAAGAGRLLAAVRRGAGLVVVAPRGTPLADSLGVRYGVLRSYALDNGEALWALGDSGRARAASCEVEPVQQRRGSQYVTGVLDSVGARAADMPTDGMRADGPVLLAGRHASRTQPVVRGFSLGAGRVVVVADGTLLENDVTRICWAAAGPVALRALHWVAPGGTPGRLIALHPGGPPAADAVAAPSVARSVRRALTEVSAGRALVQALAAALLLLAAAAPRALAPRPRPRAARRSPFEHVSALAHAYRAARATRVATRRLVAGLRRRHPALGPDDTQALDAVAARHPARAADVARLRAALVDPASPSELVAIGDAVSRIDHTLSAARRGAEPATS